MAVAVVMPALEMAQETGVLIRWLKREGESVEKGEPLMEVETDKAAMEIESPGAGTLSGVRAAEGDEVPVGQTIAWLLGQGEEPPAEDPGAALSGRARRSVNRNGSAASPGEQETQKRAGSEAPHSRAGDASAGATTASGRAEAQSDSAPGTGGWAVTPLARNIAKENNIDLSLVRPAGTRIEKADVLAYMRSGVGSGTTPRLIPASPKARRLAAERGIDLRALAGSGPEGAVLVADLASADGSREGHAATYETPGSLWRTMADRMHMSWTTVPHFYLMREVEASRLLEWRERSGAEVERRGAAKLTLTDLLVKSVAATLRNHRRLNAAWSDGKIKLNDDVNVGIAAALEEGLVVPVIAHADSASLAEISARRAELLTRARDRKLRSEDVANGTFTITNLGMYKVDGFGAIVNPPQAAILAVGRIAERVVPIDGRPEVRPMMILTLSCDHRVVDGARAARFLDELVSTIEDPWRLLI